MLVRDRVYVRSNIRRSILEVTNSPNRAIFLSPYLTSNTAENVISRAEPNDAEIYTTFLAENFAAGASSIRTLRSLLEEGYDIYHLPNLHAKVVLTEEYASIGSQNLTTGGTRNREISVALTDERDLKSLRSQMARWFVDRFPVTIDMVADMEELLPSLRKLHKDFEKAVQAANLEMASKAETREAERQAWEEEQERKELERQIAAQRQLQVEAEEQKRLELERRLLAEQQLRAALEARSEPMRMAIRSAEVRSAERIFCELVTKGRYKDGDWIGSYGTLERYFKDESFLEWSIESDVTPAQSHSLTKRNRYLIMLLNNGRLAWPALNIGQITDFGVNTNAADPMRIGNHNYLIRLELPSDETSLQEFNVVAKVGPVSKNGTGGLPGIVVRGYFSLSDFTIVDFDFDPEAETVFRGTSELYRFIENDSSAIRNSIIKELLEPFRFEKNRAGINAHEYFNGQGSLFYLQLHEFHGYKFLTAERA